MPATDLSQAHKDNCNPRTDFTRDNLSVVNLSSRYVSVVIENTVVHAFVDTGADVSIISEEFRMSTPALQKKQIVKQIIPLTGVTGHPLDAVGLVTVNLSMAHKPMTHALQVVRNCAKPLILGWDFLVANGIIVDTRNMSLLVDDKLVPLVSPCQYIPKLTEVTVVSTVEVPAMSEMVITAKLDTPLKGLVPNGYTGVFEPHYTNQSSTGFARTVAKVKQGSIYVKIANPLSENVMLHCGTQIGTFHATSGSTTDEYTVMEDSVCNVNIQVSVVSNPFEPQDVSNPGLTKTQNEKLRELLNSFSDVFSQHAHDFGRTNLVTHKITTRCDIPISQRAYRTSPSL